MPYPFALEDFTGRRFGRLVVQSLLPYEGPGKGRKWLCRCDCGNEHVANSGNLRKGFIRSCGCLYKETRKDLAIHLPRWGVRRTHGKSTAPEYGVWSSLKRRCLDPNQSQYRYYGGRGITVCPAWLNSFEQFFADMGPRPSANHSIDRIDNDGPYSPENCRWATAAEQARNKRNIRLLTHDGRTQTLAEWSRETGISIDSIRARIKMGWSVAEALTRPLCKDRRCG